MSIDVVKKFMQDCIVFDTYESVEKETLYKVYKNWCEENQKLSESSLAFKRKFLALCEGFDVVSFMSRKNKDCRYLYLRAGLNSWSKSKESLHK